MRSTPGTSPPSEDGGCRRGRRVGHVHGYIYGIYVRWGERQLTSLRHLPMSTSATTRLPSYLSTRLITYRSGMLGAYSELSYLALALCCLSSRLGCYSRLSAPIGTSRHLAVQRSEHLRCTCVNKYFSSVVVCEFCRVSCVIALRSMSLSVGACSTQ